MCKISVAMATYNGEKFIAQQLHSILNQLDAESEVIISDNNSSDKTTEIIKGLKDKRIKLFYYAEKGTIANFENALNHVTGEIIFLSDQDDIWLADKVKTIKAYLDKYDLVMSDSKIVNENLEVINNSYYTVKNAGKGLLKNLISNTYQGSNMAFKKKLLNIALPFPKKIPMHDIWLSFVAELFYSTYFIPEKLSLYRRHNTNASSSTERSQYSFFSKLKFRYMLIQQIPLLLRRKKTSS